MVESQVASVSHVSEWRKQIFPKAWRVVELALEFLKAGQTVTAEQAVPVYIRDEVAVKQFRR